MIQRIVRAALVRNHFVLDCASFFFLNLTNWRTRFHRTVAVGLQASINEQMNFNPEFFISFWGILVNFLNKVVQESKA